MYVHTLHTCTPGYFLWLCHNHNIVFDKVVFSVEML